MDQKFSTVLSMMIAQSFAFLDSTMHNLSVARRFLITFLIVRGVPFVFPIAIKRLFELQCVALQLAQNNVSDAMSSSLSMQQEIESPKIRLLKINLCSFCKKAFLFLNTLLLCKLALNRLATLLSLKHLSSVKTLLSEPVRTHWQCF